jgi:hypothetical protein
MTGIGGMRYVAALLPINPQYRLADCVFHAQEMESKHSKAKADLDELVSNMEGL